MKDLIVEVAKALVDKPDEVKVNQVDGEKTTIYELSVAQDDLGKVIGKQGRIAKAIRIILNAAATKRGKRVDLEIID